MSKTKWQQGFNTFQKHLMTGIGYMIPVIVAPGIVMGVAQVAASMLGLDIKSAEALVSMDALTRCLAWMQQVAGPQCRDLMYPVLAAYISYSIANRTGLIVGFFGGLLSVLSGAGFFGAVITGFLGGYLMNFLKKQIKVSRTYLPIMNMVVYPLIGTLAIFLAAYFIINPLGNWITQSIVSLINVIGNLGGVAISFILAAGNSFDIGGPVSKGFMAITLQLADAGFSKGPLSIGSVVPAIGFGFATLLDKFVLRKHLFTEDLQASGTPALILGLLCVAEGGLPLLLSDLLFMIPINCLGGGLAAASAYLFGVHMPKTVPGGILGVPLMEKPLLYILSILIGALTVAALILLRRMRLAKKFQNEKEA